MEYDGEDNEHDRLPEEEEEEYEYFESAEDADGSSEDISGDGPACVGLNIPGSYVAFQSDNPSCSAVLPVYKQLAGFCLVDVDETNFFTATITIQSGDQFLLLQILFPSSEPYFPLAPPRLDLKSVIRPPNHALNLLFNHHPLLLPLRWNLCTDIAQVVRDLAGAASQRGVIIDMYDDDEENSVYRRLVSIMRKASGVDITALFPTAQLDELPSFGVLKASRTVRDETARGCPPRGTGYSINTATRWTFESDNAVSIICNEIEKLVESLPQSTAVEKESVSVADHVIVDSVYIILGSILCTNITPDEFFRHCACYASVLRSLLLLPRPSAHIALPLGFYRLYEVLRDSSLQHPNSEATGNAPDQEQDEESLNNAQLVVQLGKLYARFGLEAEKSKMGSSGSSSLKGQGQGQEAANDVVVYLEDGFSQHAFESACASRLPASWLRRLRIELISLPDCLSRGSARVISGMHAGQPQLLKLLLYPESLDCPYCGGAFEFDVFLPENYPISPPKVKLMTTGSGSVRFNPNLYACGKVCLSLLGTWSGEPWDPKVSNLAQVAHSILFLIFVDEPLLNEPGYGVKRDETTMTKVRQHCKKLQVATLEYAYLDHFRSAGIVTAKSTMNTTSHARAVFLREYLLPWLCAAWKNRGEAAVERMICQVENESNKTQTDSSSGQEVFINVTSKFTSCPWYNNAAELAARLRQMRAEVQEAVQTFEASLARR